MDLILHLVTGFLSLYLAFTNSLAVSIENVLNIHETETTTTSDEVSDDVIAKIDSRYEKGGLIPNILIENAAYQQANIISALSAATSSATPDEAIVNIYCTYKTEKEIRATTGTGFFIHPDGIIMTNAHVAQLLLQSEIYGQDGECVVRTGSPATPAYTADLLYISPAWLRDYAAIINDQAPRGTGERDYALLYVNSGLDNKPMPARFPALAFNSELLRTTAVNSEVIAAGYPAESLLTEGIEAVLTPKVSTTSVTELMTFGSNYADVFTIAGSKVGEHGASGGPVVDKSGKTIGMITTRGDDEQFGKGSLRAITMSYISRTIKEETGFTLEQNLVGNLPYRAKLYRETMIPFLTNYLRWELGE
jgi:S1-C subfamily serine protease